LALDRSTTLGSGVANVLGPFEVCDRSQGSHYLGSYRYS
jgi:hypothetical protein